MRRQQRRGVRITVDLDPQAGVPIGRLTDERGVTEAFSGWLELMDRIESALRRARAGAATPR